MKMDDLGVPLFQETIIWCKICTADDISCGRAQQPTFHMDRYHHVINGNSRILNWRYLHVLTIYEAEISGPNFRYLHEIGSWNMHWSILIYNPRMKKKVVSKVMTGYPQSSLGLLRILEYPLISIDMDRYHHVSSPWFTPRFLRLCAPCSDVPWSGRLLGSHEASWINYGDFLKWGYP